jgi:microcystin-dependent protein
MGVLGEIRLFPYDDVPEGFLECKGQVLEIREFPKLYMMIGNKYGKADPHHFLLPNFNKKEEHFHYCIAIEGEIPQLNRRKNKEDKQ